MKALELLMKLNTPVGDTLAREAPVQQGIALLERLKATGRKAEAPTVVSSPLEALQAMEKSGAGKEVVSEAQRIKAIPKWKAVGREDNLVQLSRAGDETIYVNTAELDLTSELSVAGGKMRLKPIQSLALHWMRETGGLLGPLAVGAGKTLITLLAPVVLGAKRPILLVPPSMQIPLRREIEKYRAHFKMPKNLTILPYSVLSQASSTDLLGGQAREGALFPDLIVADEAHHLRHATSARTKRVLRYFRKFPETKFVALSGTLTSRGLEDYAHLAELALRENCPLPLEARELLAWANCLDAGSDSRKQDIDLFSEFHDIRGIENRASRLAKARTAFRERLISTPGVVATKEGSVEASLLLTRRHVAIPRTVLNALNDLNETWTRPDGEELVTALDRWRVANQLVQGFYYYWDWPGGEVDHQWMSARAFWHKEVRRVVQLNVEGLDSLLLVRNAVLSGAITDSTVVAAWHGWKAVRDRPQPPTKARWIDEFFIDSAMAWTREHPKGIVWYTERTVLDKLAERGLEVYQGGDDPPEDGRGMGLSIASHGTGRNLQANAENLILSFPSSGKTCEQLLGRTHRYGQLADEVTFDFFAPNVDTQRCVEKAIRDAKYIEETQGSPQKLCYATWVGRDWDGS